MVPPLPSRWRTSAGELPAAAAFPQAARLWSRAGPAFVLITNVARPKDTQSPGVTGVGALTRQPFTLVPLVDPRSSSSQLPSARTRLACQRETVSSARG